MAKNITLMGANYPNVPAVALPQTGGGTATFYDMEKICSLDEKKTHTITNNTGYCDFLIVGFMQNKGGFVLEVHCHGGSIVKTLIGGADIVSSMTITVSNGVYTFDGTYSFSGLVLCSADISAFT